jgi:gamma-glutamylcyclotransferase (GGCT)/AIG2-like uncharacterized protein YtfP
MNETISLFIYGTLKQENIQRALLGHELSGVEDRLAGYRKITVKLDDTLYPDIEPADGEHVDGLVVHVGANELHMLDTYEGREYVRKEVVLESGTRAWVYAAQHPH